MADREHSPADEARPAPEPSAMTQPYWDSAARGRLAIQRCSACRHFTHPPRSECSECGGTELGFEPVSGRGRLETFSIVHRSFAAGFRSGEPYVIAWVLLEEQPALRIFTNIVQTELDTLRVDMPVEVTFTPLPGFGLVPEFHGIGDASDMTRL